MPPHVLGGASQAPAFEARRTVPAIPVRRGPNGDTSNRNGVLGEVPCGNGVEAGISALSLLFSKPGSNIGPSDCSPWRLSYTLTFHRTMVDNFNEKSDFIWSIADLLRGDYKQSEYQKVILPLTVLRRLDCVTERNKDEVLERYEQLQEQGIENVAPSLKKAADAQVYNTSEYTFESLCNDPDDIAENLQYYINQYDEETKKIFEKFAFNHQIDRLADADLLYKVVRQFAEIDLHPDEVPNEEMGYIYEELIRKFNELSNETAGEHFTPREVIELMVNLVFQEDDEALTEQDAIRTVYDPACGTGGMLSVAEEYVRQLNTDANLHVFGQELNPESYAVCNSDMLIKGQEPENIIYGNSFTEDGFPSRTFDYMLSNPPFGVSWKKVKDQVVREHEEEGFAGRFGAGTPRTNDGAFLFLQHMLSKMKSPTEGGSPYRHRVQWLAAVQRWPQ